MIHSATCFDNINFDGGNLSSDGGSILLSSFIANHHFLDSLSAIPFHDYRKGVIHSNTDIMRQLIERHCLGYFNQKDQDVLRNDPLLRFNSTPASQPTISRFFDRVSEKSNRRFKSILQKQACQFISKNVDTIIMDADSTLATTNGCQEAAAYISHYGQVGYHPLVINEFNTKLLLSSQLRAGNTYSSNGIIEELQGIFPYISGKDHRLIKFRGDSAFYNNDLMDYLESMSCIYFIRAKGYKKLHETIMEKIYRNKINPDHYTANEPYYGEVRYTVGKSNKSRRMVFKMFSYTEGDGQLSLFPSIYCVITNQDYGDPKSIMNFYEARGMSENFTKELKNDFNGGTLSHKDFNKNEMEFLFSSYAYNLFHMFQWETLEGNEKTITMATYRKEYQKIAVKVVRHSRKISLHFSSAYTKVQNFYKYLSKVLGNPKGTSYLEYST